MSCGEKDQLVIGLTGGIACGKSTVLACFDQLGWETISADVIAHRLLKEDERVETSLRKEFGEEIFSSKGTVDKGRLGRLIFNDPPRRRWLEKLLHPLIRKDWLHAVKVAKVKCIVVEVPLLFENALESEFDFVVSVFSNERTQMHRLLERGLDKTEAENRIATQLPVEEKACRADFVLLSEGEVAYLKRQVERLCINFS